VAKDLAIASELLCRWARQAEIDRGEELGVIHHSDRGSQYTPTEFRRGLQSSGLIGSMGTVGDALDNAVAESFFATLQTELLDRYTSPTRSLPKVPIFEFIEAFYNRRRRHSSLEYLSPDDYETGRFVSEQSAA